jgi:hypothetical protein
MERIIMSILHIILEGSGNPEVSKLFAGLDDNKKPCRRWQRIGHTSWGSFEQRICAARVVFFSGWDLVCFLWCPTTRVFCRRV